MVIEITDGLGIAPQAMMSLPPRLRMRLLNFLLRWKRYEEALPLASALAEDQPEGLLYRAALIKVLAAFGDFETADAILGELDHKFHGRPNLLSAAGDLEMARGELPAALENYLKMLESNPNSPKAWRRLASLYLAAEQHGKAHTFCRKVLDYYEGKRNGGDDESQPHPEVFRVLSAIYRARGDEILAAEIDSKLRDREALEESTLRADIEIAQLSNTSEKPHERRPRKVSIIEEPVAEPPQPNEPAPKLPVKALECLREVFGFDGFRHCQEEVVSRILSRQNLLVIMPTGAGKSLCYQLPAALGRKVVVISPLIALMKDQVDGLPEALAEKATLINSTLEPAELEERLKGLVEGKYNLVYVAPERLRQMPFLHAVKQAGVDLFVVDEVHCVSVWGHDFRPDYLFIAPALQLLGNPPFCGMTATAGPVTRREIAKRIGQLAIVSAGICRPNLTFEVRHVANSDEKMRMLALICSATPGSGIVYANSRAQTEKIAEYLRSSGLEASHYHAGMGADERSAAQDAFMRGKCRVMVATVAFGMGVDKRDVRFVVHFSLPKSLESYYQEAGRAGRDGEPARCVLLYSGADKGRLTAFASAQQVGMDEIQTVYESIRRLVPRGAGPVRDEDVQRVSQLEDTQVKVSISILERVGLLRRHLDVPSTVGIGVRHKTSANEDFTRFVASAGLKTRCVMSIDFMDLASRTDVAPEDLEETLLDWRDSDFITYRSNGRCMFIELCRAEPGVKSKIQEMLDDYRVESKQKAEKLSQYAKTSGCRHDFISKHFGEAPVVNCQSCDNCLKDTAPRKLEDDHMTVLNGVLTLPIRFGKSGLLKALRGAKSCPVQPHEWEYLGVFSEIAESVVKEMIEDLVAWGYLETDGTVLRPLLVLTPAGRKLAAQEAGEPVSS